MKLVEECALSVKWFKSGLGDCNI